LKNEEFKTVKGKPVENYIDNKNRRRWWIIAIIIVIGLAVIVLGGYLVWDSIRTDNKKTQAMEKIVREVEKPAELPRMANQPPKIKTPEPITPTYAPDAPLLEQVREAMRKGIDPDGALEMAKSLPDKPERADAAFILLEYAAEAENGEAALEVGRYFDPTFAGDSGTIIKDPEHAYDWYQLALSQGVLEADVHLSNLKQWVTKQAAEGSYKSRELLKNWQ
jgi:type IV secretory pathway VirB10-like protein